MNYIVKHIIFVCLIFFTWQTKGQSITIEECYKLAKENYPLAKQRDLIAKSQNYNMQNALKNFLPQINISAQATYQSDVTSINIPAPFSGIISIENPAKDQYKLYGEVTQTIYDGGTVKNQNKLYEASANVEIQRIETILYSLNERITDLYFGILLINSQLKQNELFKQDIRLALNKVQASVDNGIALKSNVAALKAETIKVEQRNIELTHNKKAYIGTLGGLINKALTEETVFEQPPLIHNSQNIQRPELKLFEEQNKALEAQKKMINAKNLPKLGAFLQGGIGRPALNMFKNSFEPYFIGGIRLTVPISVFYTQKNDLALLSNNQLSNNVQKETFLFNTKFEINKQNEEIDKLNQLIVSDNELVALRESIKKTSMAQLENGVINSNDYLRELNAEDLSKQNKKLHELQLLMTLYKQKITSGN